MNVWTYDSNVFDWRRNVCENRFFCLHSFISARPSSSHYLLCRHVLLLMHPHWYDPSSLMQCIVGWHVCPFPSPAHSLISAARWQTYNAWMTNKSILFIIWHLTFNLINVKKANWDVYMKGNIISESMFAYFLLFIFRNW